MTDEAAAVLVGGLVAGVADMALEIVRFVAVEVVEGVLAAVGKWAVVAMMRVVAVVDVTVKPAGAVEPGTRSDEDAAVEPVRAVVAVRGEQL